MPEIDPDGNEEGEVGKHERGGEVVEDFGRLFPLSLASPTFPPAKQTKGEKGLTARKKSEMSCVIYTATPMYVK